MKPDSDAVRARLQQLREMYVAETVEEASERLARESRPRARPLAEAAAQRLEELRALCELGSYLHRRRSP